MRRLIQVPVLAIVFLLVCASGALASEVDVNTTKDTAPSDSECSGVPGDCSLRQAIDKAQSGDTVALPGTPDSPAVYSITLGSTLSVNKTLAIKGNGPGAAIIDGSANDGGRFNEGFRILTVGGGQVTLSGVTFRDGSDGNDEQFQFCSPCETLNANGGGAVFNNGASVALDNVAFTGDSAPVGGAVSNGAGGTLTMTDVSFTDNGGGIGGALFTHSGSVTGTGVTFENNGNGSFGGGAAYLGSGTVNLTNATIVGNGWASTFGGGIDNAGATLTLLDDTFSGNVRGAIETDNGITKVGNTIIGAGFSDGSDFACVAAGKRNNNDFTTSNAITTDLGNNIDEDGHCKLRDPSDKSGVSADLAPIADNGGPTRTQALLAGSSALGDPSSSNCPDVDQRDTPRPAPKCDIGAFEAVLHGSPTASTGDAGNLTDTSADLFATINLDGEAGGFHFLYGTKPDNLSNRTDEAAAGVPDGDTSVSEPLGGLTPDTTYYFEAVADNATASTPASAVHSFTTQPGPPVIGDQISVDSITDTAATIHFSINPQGSHTTYVVEYGPDSNYGHETQPVDIGAAPGAQDLSAKLTGLDPNSTVHFDIVAGNDVQQDVHSFDTSFNTLQQITGFTGQLVTVTDNQITFGCPTPSNTTVDWADDSSDTSAQIQCHGGGEEPTNFELSDSHIYIAPGDYQVTINYADLRTETDVIAHISDNPDGLTNTGPPTIAGSPHEGQTLTTTDGAWEGNPTGFDYQWQDCDANGQNCTATGEDANSYTLTQDDLGQTIRVIVSASNDNGHSDSVSDPTAPVSPPAPTNTIRPAITGTAQPGQTLTTTDGTWDGDPTDFHYQWQDCDSSGQNCTNTGTDTTTYALTSGDVGHTIQVIVTAEGAGGSAHATSNRTAAVAAPQGSPPPGSPPPSSPPTTTPASPTVGAANAQTVTVTSAGFSGSVTPNGLPTQAHFEYGLDPRYSGGGPIVYDHSTPDQPVGSDFSSHGVGAVAISGLLPNALYHVRLVANNSNGTTFGPDATFTTAAAPAPSAPILGKTVNVTPVSGFVLIKVNGKFVPLTGAEQIPSGSQIDARHGSLELITSTGQKGKTQHGIFGGAIFKLTQAHNGLVILKLVEGAFKGAPSYAVCKAHKAADATIASSKALQLLKASAHGKFRTSGRYSAATVRGTKWTVADRCDGTLTHVITDSVTVTDFVRHKTIILHAGQSYLARARKTA